MMKGIIVLGAIVVLSHGSPVKISNGIISVGVDSDYGCSITYTSDAHNSDNLINLHDKGREIQQSYYSGPNPYRNGSYMHQNWPWNPTTAGDIFKHSSSCSIQRISDTQLYTRVIPLQWALNNVPCECQMEQWITLDGKGYEIKSKLTTWRSDAGDYGVYDQEMPAVYVIGKYFRLISYSKDKPWQNDAIDEVDYPVPGPPWANFQANENWAAFMNRDLSYGLGVMNDKTSRFLGGFHGTKGSGSNFDDETGYMAPVVREDIPSKGTVEWSARIAIGNLATIRNYFSQKRQSSQ